MKRIKDLYKIMPSEKANRIKLDLEMRAQAPENFKNYLKEDAAEALKHREEFLKKDRRRFLDMIGKAGISTGLLRSSAMIGGIMANRHALAAPDISNMRVVYCYFNSGAQPGSWLPSSATTMNAVSQPYGPGAHDVASICNFRQVNVLASGHSNATQAIGVPGYGIPTMDTRIARVLGATSPYSHMYLGSEATTSGTLCSTLGPCQDNPVTAYTTFFKTAPPSLMQDTSYLRAHRANKNALEEIKNKLSLEERNRIDIHAAALQKIEDRLTAAQGGGMTGGSCGPTATPVDPGNIQQRGRLQADIIVAALQCGLTKVATLQVGNHQGPWHGHNTAYKGDSHNSCHSDGPNTFDEMQRYINDVPAYFLKRLMLVAGPDGRPLIESTVFVQVTCMGNGRDHTPDNGPFMVATKRPGFSNTFSASRGGTTEDLHGAIPKGLGIDKMLTGMGTPTLGLLA